MRKKEIDLLAGFAGEAKRKKEALQKAAAAGKPVPQGPEADPELERSKIKKDPKTGKEYMTMARLRPKRQRFGGGKHRGME